jgi:hypothetical protein
MERMKLESEFLFFFNSQNDKIYLFLKIMVGNVVVHEQLIVRLISLSSRFMVNFTKAPILMWQEILDHGNVKSPPNTSKDHPMKFPKSFLSVGLGCEVQMKIGLN